MFKHCGVLTLQIFHFFFLLFVQENIECDFELVTSSPAALISLMDSPGAQSLVYNQQQEQSKGLLWMLEEEALFPGASEDGLMDKVTIQHGNSSSDKRE